MTERIPTAPPPSLDMLAQEGPLALFLDFDGTLVDLAETPDGIVVPEGLAADIAALADRFDGRLALVSGRALDDLVGHLGSVDVCRAGSHGADRRDATGAVIGRAAAGLPDDVIAAMRAWCVANAVDYETKTHGGALHFRRRPDAEDAAHAFAGELAERHGLDLKRGSGVIELVRPGANKGAAVRDFMDAPPFAGARPIFLGDDITDEDGFAAVAELGGLGILVCNERESHARYRLPDVAAVHDWLGL